MRNNGWDVPNGEAATPQFKKLLSLVRRMQDNKAFMDILEKIGRDGPIRITAGQVGEAKQGGTPADDVDCVHTVVALAYRILKFSRSSRSDENSLLFDGGLTREDDPDVILGWTPDDWTRALRICTHVFARRTLRKCDPEDFEKKKEVDDIYGRYNLCSKAGPKGEPIGMPYADANEASGLLPDAAGQDTWENAAAVHMAKLDRLLQHSDDEDDAEPHQKPDMEDVEGRGVALAGVSNVMAMSIGMVPGSVPAADIESRSKESGLPAAPKPDMKTLDSTFRHLERTYKELPSRKDDLELSAAAFRLLVSEEVKMGFLSKAEAATESVAAHLARRNNSLLDHQDKEDADEIMENCHTIQAIGSRNPPWNIDIRTGCEALGLDKHA